MYGGEVMSVRPLISFCIPTNGVIEWMFPVLESIYLQNVDSHLFEVVVMDNGNNKKFQQMMEEFVLNHSNTIYKKTNAYEFLSEIESYKAASGIFIKFINHRTKLLNGTLQYLIDFVDKHQDTKPVIYFSNGELKVNKSFNELNSFDDFIRGLSYWSSWSTGMAFWKSDFDAMQGLDKCNALFPHTNILFAVRKNRHYIIDNKILLDEIPAGKIPKGRYNLFNAFAVEYPLLISDLYRNGDISAQTLLKIKKDNLRFVAALYLDYVILRKKCSYDLIYHKEAIAIFYSKASVLKQAAAIFGKRLLVKCTHPLSRVL